MSDVVCNINGTNYSGWTSVDITISMQTLAGVFNLGLTDNVVTGQPISPTPTVIPLQSCAVSINGQLVITGWVDKVTPMIDSEDHTIIAQGRDKTGDLVDCSMIQPVAQFFGLTVDKIITIICQPFGIPVSVGQNVNVGDPITVFVVEQGATCIEVITKLCYLRQLLAISDGKGGLTLTTTGKTQASTSIVEGINILKGQADYDTTQRFSQYLVKGQKQGDDLSTPTTNTGIVGQYNDPVINRYRPMLIMADGQVSINDCNLRASWEASIAIGRSKKYTITLNGWAQQDGTLWGINTLVQLQSARLGVSGTFLISDVNFKLDENGELTILTITDPHAYTIQSKALIKSAGLQKSNPYQL